MAKNNTLLFLSSENCRLKIKEIANLNRSSSQRIKYNLRNLERKSLINLPYSIFDYSYFGLILFKVYFKWTYVSEKDKNKIIKELKENGYVVAVYELEGEFDLVVEIEAPNPSRFNKTLKQIVTNLPSLSNYRILLNIVTHIYPRKYLAKEEEIISQVPAEIVIGGDREIEEFNEKAMILLQNLRLNPKTRLSSLAKAADLNIRTVSKLFKELKQRKIVRGFKYNLNTEELKINKSRLFLKLHNLTPEREEEMQQYFLKTKEIIQMHKTVGDWDLELDIESFEKVKIRRLTVEIREQFKDVIMNFNIIEFYKQYLRYYLPEFLFKAKEEKKE
ncbi:hypothetical protein COY27_02810 [Candidatus Woesearchaeota archaeon CG_4_10_14_0_2_um_filter_33_13]|nr:MAG: hypothetical protein COY27_02810 [Candidatus Woesearchaeota archaeon CG_4_10_14_0_2_um_filter_33_13]